MVSQADGTEQFRAAAQALNDAADREVRTQVYGAFRRAAKPLSDRMIQEGSPELPHRGGLAARVGRAKASQSNATTGRNPSVAIRLKTPDGYSLRAMDEGHVRHPVFARAGRPRKWVVQSIPKHAFTKVFEAGADGVRKEVLDALEQVARDIRNGTARGSGAALGRSGG